MKEDITQSNAKKLGAGKNKAKCSSTPKIIKLDARKNKAKCSISLACSKCGKALSYEDSYLVNTGQKVTTWRFKDAALLAFYCEACLPAEKQIGKK